MANWSVFRPLLSRLHHQRLIVFVTSESADELTTHDTRTYLIIVRAMRCGHNGMGARREVQSIRALLTSRVTQPTPVRPRRAEQVPSGLPDGCDPGAGCRVPSKRVLVRTYTVASP